jgi:predicted TIM-barrel fold metal-dependent hydrolase
MYDDAEDSGYTIFLHPHYGVGTEHYHDSGHALFLALGFPFETTVCVSRLITSGMMDKVPNLKLLVAHAGAALPSLIGRLDSCVEHDHAICNRLQHKPSDYFKKMYFDAISYDGNALETLVNQVGSDRIVFGTDNPFFPPLHTDDYNKAEWPSTTKVKICLHERKRILSLLFITYHDCVTACRLADEAKAPSSDFSEEIAHIRNHYICV